MTSVTAAKRSVRRQNLAADGWLMLSAIAVASAVLVIASNWIGFACLCAPPTSISQLLEILLPTWVRPPADSIPLGLLPDLRRSRVLSDYGAVLIVPLVLQSVACAAVFVGTAVRSSASMGALAALILVCNPAWLLLLAQHQSIAVVLVAIMSGGALISAFSQTKLRYPLAATALFLGPLAVTSEGIGQNASAAVRPLLVLAALAPLLAVLAVLAVAFRPGRRTTAKATALGVVSLGVVAWVLVGLSQAGLPVRREIEEERAKLVSHRALGDLLRPFVRNAGSVVLWDQSARAPHFGRVTTLPGRNYISPYELSYALRSIDAPVLVIITCSQRNECIAAHNALDTIDIATEILLKGGTLSFGSESVQYSVIRLLIRRP